MTILYVSVAALQHTARCVEPYDTAFANCIRSHTLFWLFVFLFVMMAIGLILTWIDSTPQPPTGPAERQETR